MFRFSVKHIFAVIIGVPIFFLLSRFLSIPLYENAMLTLAYAFLGFFAVIYGPVVGFTVGFIGYILYNFTLFLPLSWSWIFLSAFVGFTTGVIFKPRFIEAGIFNKENIIRFITGSLIIHAGVWFIIAPILDIAFYDFSVKIAFLQGLIAGFCNFGLTAVIGTVLIYGYAKIRFKSIMNGQ